jgi:hypothetical protein
MNSSKSSLTSACTRNGSVRYLYDANIVTIANPDLVLQTAKTAKNPVSSRNRVFNVFDRPQQNLQLFGRSAT